MRDAESLWIGCHSWESSCCRPCQKTSPPGHPRGSIDIINVQKCWNLLWMKKTKAMSSCRRICTCLIQELPKCTGSTRLLSRKKSQGTAFLGVSLLHGRVEKPQPVAHPPWPPEGPPTVELCGQRPLSCQLGPHAIPKNSVGWGGDLVTVVLGLQIVDSKRRYS